MWRFVAGGVATLLMVALGVLLMGWRGDQPPAAAPPLSLAAAPQAESPAPEVPSTLPAAPERSREQKRFDRYDKDRDSRITREEYLASRRKAFAKLDANGDGRLSFDEWAVKTTTRFAGADRDKSGTLTAAEFATTAPKRRARPTCACPPAAARDDD